ncbi:hypothetical protein TNCV_2046821 [Trichonephila clavipes]|uniref:Uncharacterized protein n=1 Tax=Trichonephila clavipes TaxID=2585209 RepID=A0A8X6T1N4_TRICX|nr:hypothetical protein TNCV_2046821 [Trichonephila clavipes]
MWDHRDRVVRAMEPHPRNLVQLVAALESAWLNITVNAFRNLIDFLYVAQQSALRKMVILAVVTDHHTYATEWNVIP